MKVKANEHNLMAASFAAVAIEAQLEMLRNHKHPHRPAIEKCRQSMIFLKNLSSVLEKELGEKATIEMIEKDQKNVDVS